MLTHRRLLLSCVLFAMTAPACGGRSGLDDFSKGADDIITGSTEGTNNGPDNNGEGGVGPGAGGDNGGGDNGGGDNGGDAQGNGSGNGNGNQGGNEGGSGGGDAPVGSKCERDSSCQGDNAECLTEVSIGGFFMLDFPKGYCAVQGCEDDGDCPKGGGCLNALGMQVCLKTCDSERDCRVNDGYACSSLGGGGGGFPGGGGMGGGGQGPSFCLPPFGGMGGGGFPGM